jgi:PBP1b-binding outer membrane lipoprotein LpoB
MKKLIPSIIVLALFVIGCNSDSDTSGDSMHKENTTKDTSTNHEMMAPVAEQQYACSMHPEVIGKKDEKCSECGMKLTEPVKN